MIAVPMRVLLIQSEAKTAQVLSEYFTNRGDSIWKAADFANAKGLLPGANPDLVLLDLHLPGNDWIDSLAWVHANFPHTKIIVTNEHPDVKRELQAREYGVTVFLRQPGTRCIPPPVIPSKSQRSAISH